MYIFKQKAQIKKYLQPIHGKDLSIGFVPTMGALHAGHLSLIERAKAENDVVVCSIFINPTQFNEHEDFEKYPVQTDTDIKMLLECNLDILFLPDKNEIYPEGLANLEHYDFGKLETLAEGAHRPGHFQGVGQVLSRLLKIIEPDKMYMGQKDFQQWLITRKLIRLTSQKTEVVAVPIQREKEGLAMSSRNVRLSEKALKIASSLYLTLHFVSNNLNEIPLHELLEKASGQLEDKGFTVEYLMLARAEDLQPVDQFTKDMPQILLVAAWLEGVRLIDNLMVNPILS